MKNFLNKFLLIPLILFAFNINSQETFILNYEDVDIKKVSQDIAQFAKKTIIIDPRVKGKISIYSNASLTRDQVWNVYLRTIQVSGFSAISDNGFVRIVPENEATRDANFALDERADYITEIISLRNRSTDEILPMIKPITGRQSHLSSIPSINSILVVDRSSNVTRIKDLLKDLDKNNTSKISIIELSKLSAVEAVRILDRLKSQNNPAINKFIAIPFAPSNSVIISANDYITSNIKDTLKKLDEDIKTDNTIEVIYLKFAKAQEVASILSTVSGKFKNSIATDNIDNIMHEFDEAINLNLSALKFQSNSNQAYIFSKLSRLYLSKGNINEARNYSLKLIEKYPDDIGLIVHEGVHVVQLYPSFHPGWLTEGIADYIRWHLYEKKQLDWFPLSKNEKGWEDAYQVTGGFLLWLTIEKNPNIVKILHSAMKTESYSDSIFNENCGNDLPKLWMDYNDFRDEK